MDDSRQATENIEDLERRNHELSVLNAIARELNRSINLNDTLRFTLAQVAELLGLSTGWIWLLNEQTSEPYLAAYQNLPPALSDNPRRMDGTDYCYCLDTYRNGDLEGAANVNVLTCSRLKGLVDGTDGLRYHASIPLYAQEKKLGVMNVASPGWRSLSRDDLQLLYTVGDLLAIAVERARLFSRSERFGAVEERNRLARDIHDTIAQGLNGRCPPARVGGRPDRSRLDPRRSAGTRTESTFPHPGKPRRSPTLGPRPASRPSGASFSARGARSAGPGVEGARKYRCGLRGRRRRTAVASASRGGFISHLPGGAQQRRPSRGGRECHRNLDGRAGRGPALCGGTMGGVSMGRSRTGNVTGSSG